MSDHIPVIGQSCLSYLAGKLGPIDRRALREICERGDLIEVDGLFYILAPVTPETMDALAAFEAETEDREWEPDDDVETDCGKDGS
jgi:hypothetical protein